MEIDTVVSLKPNQYLWRSTHQRDIESLFGRHLLREFTDAELEHLGRMDLCMIVFTNRSGSTYLTEILHLMAAGVHPRSEFFNHNRVRKGVQKNKYKTFNDYLMAIVNLCRDDNRVGFKVGIKQLFWLTRLGLLEPFRNVRVINSLRDDMLGQAVSHYKARKTGEWHSMMKADSREQLSYSRDDILLSLRVITEGQANFNYYCAIHRPPRLDVVYEELLREPLVSMQRLADYLEIPDFDPQQLDLNAVGIQQQRDAENEVLRQEFEREFRLGSSLSFPGDT